MGPSAPGPTPHPRPARRPPAGSRGTGCRCEVTGENREGATEGGKLCVVVNAFESRGGHRRREDTENGAPWKGDNSYGERQAMESPVKPRGPL